MFGILILTFWKYLIRKSAVCKSVSTILVGALQQRILTFRRRRSRSKKVAWFKRAPKLISKLCHLSWSRSAGTGSAHANSAKSEGPHRRVINFPWNFNGQNQPHAHRLRGTTKNPTDYPEAHRLAVYHIQNTPASQFFPCKHTTLLSWRIYKFSCMSKGLSIH